ncbi:MAG: multicopper oxidase family protein [Anaeromyxobacteraceae bacterium]
MRNRVLLTTLLAAAVATGCSNNDAAKPQAVSPPTVVRTSRPLDPETLAQFETPLPVIPVRTPDTTKLPGKDYYVVTAQQGVHDFGLRHMDGSEILDLYTGQPIRTSTWGYDTSYLGPTIEARSNRPVVVKYVNDLRDSAGKLATAHLLTIDPTIDGANHGEPAVRVVPHLHGGHVAAEFDGHPKFWFTNDPSAPANGLGGPAGNSVEYTYDNTQDAATLWFHDHAMGVTRLNVYAGLTAFYLLRDDAEDALKLPKGAYEVPLVLQDKAFNDDGSLAYQTHPLIDPYTGDALVDKDGRPLLSSGPETFGNAIVVNGVVWPSLDVEPRKYRFRMVNGADSRFFNLWLEGAGEGPQPGLQMTQIGAEAGFMPAAVAIASSPSDGLLLGNGERADVVIDFSAFAGKTIVLRNDANAPYPDGDPVNANTTGKVMQFRVTKPLATADTSEVPAEPRAMAHLITVNNTRVVDLQELTDIYQINDGGTETPRLELRLNGLRFEDPITESPRLDTVEDWIIVNTTADMHPMHIHLVAFEVVEKGSFDADSYVPAAGGVVRTPGDVVLHKDTDPDGHTSEDAAFNPAYTVAANEHGPKDTVKIAPGGYVRVRAKFDRPGVYMWHCHILSHEEHSMMRPFQVVP